MPQPQGVTILPFHLSSAGCLRTCQRLKACVRTHLPPTPHKGCLLPFFPHMLPSSLYLCTHKPKFLFKWLLTPTLKRSSKGQNRYTPRPQSEMKKAQARKAAELTEDRKGSRQISTALFGWCVQGAEGDVFCSGFGLVVWGFFPSPDYSCEGFLLFILCLLYEKGEMGQ